LGVPVGEDSAAYVKDLLAHYGAADHPMTEVLKEGLQAMSAPKKRRGGRKARV